MFNSPNLVQVDTLCGADLNGDGIADVPACTNTGTFGSGGSVLVLDQDKDMLSIRRVYGEIKTAFGLWRIGRQPSNWGLGVLTNDGNQMDDDFGDTADRIQWIGQFGDLYVSLLYEKLLENTLGDPAGADDADDYVLAALYKKETYEGGLYFVYRKDPANDTDIYIIDLYGQADLMGATLSGELAYYTGETSDDATLAYLAECTATLECNVNVVNAVVRAEYPWEMWDFGLEVGLSRGDDSATDTDVNSIAFNPDYDVAVILFRNQPVAAGTQLGPVQNVWYAKPSAVYNLTEQTGANLAVIYGQLLSEGAAGDRQVGFEIDTGLSHDLNSNVQVGLDLGHLFASQGLNYYSGNAGEPSDITTFQGRFLFHF
ncbi:MAG: hypothetical protein HY538_00745 [Deltaproteobacteria bacterium]|nr:hypothetical protein [Deltaproteobacteria bacterium]